LATFSRNSLLDRPRLVLYSLELVAEFDMSIPKNCVHYCNSEGFSPQTSSMLRPFRSRNLSICAAGQYIQCLMYVLHFGSTAETHPVTLPPSLRIESNQIMSPSNVSYLITLCTHFLIVGACVPSSFFLRKTSFLDKNYEAVGVGSPHVKLD
jgi:hypothetical protein